VRRAIKRILRRNGIPSWVDTQFARRIGLDERLHRQHTKLRFSSFAQKDLYRSELNSGFLSQGNELESRSESWFSLEKRHPFLDRRIVEFALALPEEQRWQRNQPKFVLRRAMEGFLPETIRRRITKADFSHVFAETLQAAGGEHLFDSLTIESMGWVDGPVIREMYRSMVQDYRSANNAYISYIWKLWMVFGIELWFKVVFCEKQKVNLSNAA
jgi:asparagine synthase (glutamine-hydrolysing)